MDDPRETQNFAPEVHHRQQDDEDSQAQTIADQALGRRREFALSDSEKVGGSADLLGANTPDLVDHMNQMASSGRIDMSAFRGERNDDDEAGMYGEDAVEDDFPHGAE
jgi:hypothetical protein